LYNSALDQKRLINKKIDSLIQKFSEDLKTFDLSKNSIRFYKSDISHFAAWLIFKMKSLGVIAEELNEVTPFLKPSFAHQYKNYLIINKVPAKTINRRLTTVRKFSGFLYRSKIVSFNFAQGIENVSTSTGRLSISSHFSSLITDFQQHLKKQESSAEAIESYLADVNHFFLWLEGRMNQTK